MNRQARRRVEREGKKGPDWSLIIPLGLLVVVLLIFAVNYLFPNLDMSSYDGASPRILRRIGERGIARLRKDWPQVERFSYGHSAEEEWDTFLVDKKEETWVFENLGTETSTEYAVDNLPDFYVDIPEVLDQLQAALADKNFILTHQQTVEGMNIFSAIRTIDNEKDEREIYILSFDAEHNLDRIHYVNSAQEPLIGYAYADLYQKFEIDITSP